MTVESLSNGKIELIISESSTEIIINTTPPIISGGGGTWGSITGDIQSQTDLITELNLKVDKITGKGLSTNDYTDADKNRLADTSGENTGDQDLSGLAVDTEVFHKSTANEIGQLDPKDTLVNDDVILLEDSENGFLKAKTTFQKIRDFFKTTYDTVYESLSNKKTTLAENSDTFYPTQKAVKTAVDGKVSKVTSVDKRIATFNGITGDIQDDSLIKVSQGKIYPTTDGTTAIQFTKSDGSTVVATIDTTNKIIKLPNGIIEGDTSNQKISLSSSTGSYIYFDSNNYVRAGLGSVQLLAGGFGFLFGTSSYVRLLTRLSITGSQLPLYFDTSAIADTVNDRKKYNISGAEYSEKCIVANATKGNGTWRVVKINGAEKTLTNNTLTNIMDINVASNTMQCVIIEYSIVYRDTVNNLVRSHIGYISINVRNQGGTITSQIVHPATLENDLGTITDTWAVVNGTNKVTLNITANASGMTPTNGAIYFDVKNQGNNNITLL